MITLISSKKLGVCNNMRYTVCKNYNYIFSLNEKTKFKMGPQEDCSSFDQSRDSSDVETYFKRSAVISMRLAILPMRVMRAFIYI